MCFRRAELLHQRSVSAAARNVPSQVMSTIRETSVLAHVKAAVLNSALFVLRLHTLGPAKLLCWPRRPNARRPR